MRTLLDWLYVNIWTRLVCWVESGTGPRRWD
jgi:hypothetical protein